MVDAPEVIGLVRGPFGYRLWNWDEDTQSDNATQYLRADIAEHQLAEMRAERDHWLGEAQRLLKSGQDALDKLEAAEAERDRLAAENDPGFGPELARGYMEKHHER